MPRINVRILLADLLKHPLPQSVRERHGIRLVAHTHALQAIRPRVIKRIANDTLDSFAGIDVFLHRDLIGSTLLEVSTNTDIEPFRVLPQHDEANVFLRTIWQRREPVVKQLHWAGIDVEVEFKSQ